MEILDFETRLSISTHAGFPDLCWLSLLTAGKVTLSPPPVFFWPCHEYPPTQAQRHFLRIWTREEIRLLVEKRISECFVNLCLILCTKSPQMSSLLV